MYINEAVRQVMRFYPSEYDVRELYLWCDEVSAMLLTENKRIYREILLPVAADGSVLLPEDVDMEYVEYVDAEGTELKRCDLRTFGRNVHSIRGINGFILPERLRRARLVRVVYIEPYRPIRLPKYRGGVVFGEADISIGRCDFAVGDILDITADSGSGDKYVISDIPVFAVTRGDTGTVLETTAEALSEVSGRSSDNAVITRTVTERTACEPPFDGMYVDYCLAKINLYRRDNDGYKTHMAEFNNKLAAYRAWLIERLPQDSGALVNWW